MYQVEPESTARQVCHHQVSMDPLALDWGTLSVDLLDQTNSRVLHLCAHRLTTDEDLQNSIMFARGRSEWARRHLPANLAQTFFFDVRGQDVPSKSLDILRAAIQAFADIIVKEV